MSKNFVEDPVLILNILKKEIASVHDLNVCFIEYVFRITLFPVK